MVVGSPSPRGDRRSRRKSKSADLSGEGEDENTEKQTLKENQPLVDVPVKEEPKSPSASPERSPKEKRSRRDKDRRSKSRSRSPNRDRKRPDRSSRRGRDDDERISKRRRSSSRSPAVKREVDSDEERRAARREERAKPKDETATTVTNLLTTKTGGAYIPPAKLRMMQQSIQDKQSEAYQRLAWEQLKKKIHGLVNKVNVGNLTDLVRQLFKENIVRGRGLLARSIIQAQAFSPTFSHVYAALVAVINSKFPSIGELILRRLIIQFKRSFGRNDKTTAATACKFIAHLVNQQVVHELLSLEILTLLLEDPTDTSVEIAVAFLKECGAKLTDLTPRGMMAIFDRLREILQEQQADVRVQYMIEVALAVRRDGFKAHPAVVPELELLEESDMITHNSSLEDAQDPENMLNVFKLDPEFAKNEEVYNEIKRELLGDSDDESDDDDDDEEGEGEASGDEAQPDTVQTTTIIDKTEQNLVAFRRTVYLTLQSSLDYQEAIHKLFKMEIKPGWENELVNMVIDCCAEKRTYEKFFGLLAERLCRLRKEYQNLFEQTFQDVYSTIHRFEIGKLRNVCRMFATLLYMDAISWQVLSCIHLNEDETTSSSRIYIKTLFNELVEYMGLDKLYERVIDPTYQTAMDGIFPRNNPRDTRFSINFFTSIGIGGLTADLRQHLLSAPKQQMVQLPGMDKPTKLDSDSDDSSSSSSDDSSDSDSSSSSSDDSDDEDKKEVKREIKREPESVRGERRVEPERRRRGSPDRDAPPARRREYDDRDQRGGRDDRGREQRHQSGSPVNEPPRRRSPPPNDDRRSDRDRRRGRSDRDEHDDRDRDTTRSDKRQSQRDDRSRKEVDDDREDTARKGRNNREAERDDRRRREDDEQNRDSGRRDRDADSDKRDKRRPERDADSDKRETKRPEREDRNGGRDSGEPEKRQVKIRDKDDDRRDSGEDKREKRRSEREDKDRSEKRDKSSRKDKDRDSRKHRNKEEKKDKKRSTSKRDKEEDVPAIKQEVDSD